MVEQEVEPDVSVVPEEVNVRGADVGGNDDAVVSLNGSDLTGDVAQSPAQLICTGRSGS